MDIIIIIIEFRIATKPYEIQVIGSI